MSSVEIVSEWQEEMNGTLAFDTQVVRKQTDGTPLIANEIINAGGTGVWIEQ